MTSMTNQTPELKFQLFREEVLDRLECITSYIVSKKLYTKNKYNMMYKQLIENFNINNIMLLIVALTNDKELKEDNMQIYEIGIQYCNEIMLMESMIGMVDSRSTSV